MSSTSKWHFALIATLATLCGLYAAYWWYVSNQIQQRVARIQQAGIGDGQSLTFSSFQVGGFPYRFKTSLDNPAYRGATGLTWQPDSVDVIAQTYDLSHVIINAPGRHRIELPATRTTPAQVLELSAKQAQASLIFDGDEQVEDFALDLRDVALSAPNGVTTAIDRLQFKALPTQDEDATAPDTVTIAVKAEGIGVPEQAATSLAEKIEVIQLLARVHGPTQAQQVFDLVTTGPRNTAAPRPERITVDDFGARWGALTTTGEGTLAINERGVPDGSFSVRVAGFAETIEAVRQSGAIDDQTAAAVNTTLGVLATFAGGTGREAPLDIRIIEGEVFVGPLRVGQISPLF